MTLLNAVIIAIIAAYIIFDVYQRRNKLTCMAGMMIAMTIGMMVSICLGVLLGIYFEHDLTKSTIISVITGMIAGYAAGKPVSLMAALDGMLAGIMGGMMGAMLGVMLVIPTTMVWCINIIYAAVMFVLLQLIEEETVGTKKEYPEGKRPFFGSVGMVIGFVAIVEMIMVYKSGFLPWNTASSKAVSAQGSPLEQIPDVVQEATINVDSSGYGPQNIEIKAGVPAKINFKTGADAGCLRQVVSKELGINNILDAEKDNFIMMDGLKPGVYSYTCGMGMFGGTITVK